MPPLALSREAASGAGVARAGGVTGNEARVVLAVSGSGLGRLACGATAAGPPLPLCEIFSGLISCW